MLDMFPPLRTCCDTNKVPITQRAQIVQMLVIGMSMQPTCRIVDVLINAVKKRLLDAGEDCAVQTRRTRAQPARAARSVQRDVDLLGLDYHRQDAKLLISCEEGDRRQQTAVHFLDDLRSRLANRVQRGTDGHRVYANAVNDTFGIDVR